MSKYESKCKTYKVIRSENTEGRVLSVFTHHHQSEINKFIESSTMEKPVLQSKNNIRVLFFCKSHMIVAFRCRNLHPDCDFTLRLPW